MNGTFGSLFSIGARNDWYRNRKSSSGIGTAVLL